MNTEYKNTPDNPFTNDGAGYALSRPTYPGTLVQALSKHCTEHKVAVDIGCGTGQLSSLLAEAFEHVIALDSSLSQLNHATQCHNITYRQAFADDTGLEDQCADLITVAQAAHWFDLDRFYKEAQRIAKPNSTLAIISYGVPLLEDGEVAQRFEQFYWQDIHRFWPKERRHVEDNYLSLSFPFTELPFPNLKIERHWSFKDLAGYIATWSAMKKASSAGAEQAMLAALGEIEAIWGGSEVKRLISWPINCKVAQLNPKD